MTLFEFSKIFASLAVQLRQTDADDTTIRVYYEALKELDLAFLTWAAQRLAKESVWFPKTSEWRAMAAKIEAERIEAQRALLRKLPTPLCAACSDTGFVRNEATNRVTRCACRELRRLEVLGRRPWPALPGETALPVTDAKLTTQQTAVAFAELEDHGLRPRLRAMPRLDPATRASLHADRDGDC